MDRPAADVWDQLAPPWRAAFGEAWRSWREGNLGIGAVLVDPATGEVETRGRNRVNEQRAEPRSLTGNFMAHAEMNAFAAMDRFKADGLHLYTTLEPCLMCAGTAVFLHVEHIHFAVTDEFFADLDQLWAQHPYSARHQPVRTGPLAGVEAPLAALGRVLPLTRIHTADPEGKVMALAHERIPEVAAVAADPATTETLDAAARADRQIDEVLAELWPALTGSAGRPPTGPARSGSTAGASAAPTRRGSPPS